MIYRLNKYMQEIQAPNALRTAIRDAMGIEPGSNPYLSREDMFRIDALAIAADIPREEISLAPRRIRELVWQAAGASDQDVEFLRPWNGQKALDELVRTDRIVAGFLKRRLSVDAKDKADRQNGEDGEA